MTLDGSATRISPAMFDEDFGDLKVSATFDMHKMITLDRLLFQILRFLRIMTGDVNKLFERYFDDNKSTTILCNKRVMPGNRWRHACSRNGIQHIAHQVRE